jgi:predicted RNA methylase
MGKRSDFTPRKMDQYFTTDPKAARVLANHFDYVGIQERTFIEPCAGKGDLIFQLERNGFELFKAFELDGSLLDSAADQRIESNDAFNMQFSTTQIITNPPWTRKILHPMIEHFVDVSPSVWLLFDADWMHTKQAVPYLDTYCQRIVSVGRLKWLADSASVGKDNAAWYQFTKLKTGEIEFYHGKESKN